jgi:hypothetical protein
MLKIYFYFLYIKCKKIGGGKNGGEGCHSLGERS